MEKGGVQNAAYNLDTDVSRDDVAGTESPPSYKERVSEEGDDDEEEEYDPWALAEHEDTSKPWKGAVLHVVYDVQASR